MSQQRTDVYQSPLNGRYSSKVMQQIFSDDRKFSNWRKLWVALAEAEQKYGLNITDQQIAQLKEHIYDIDYDRAKYHENITRHDVMAHVKTYGEVCPDAAGIIHLGATSCYVTDNTDLLNIRDALTEIKKKTLGVIKLLSDFSMKYKDMPTLGFTHLQPATPTTVGKRAAIWMQNFEMTIPLIDFIIDNMKMLGCRGATGTSETFMKLFNGDHQKVKAVEEEIAKKFKFDKIYPVSGQTYTRQFDIRVLNCLAEIASSANKMALDIRELQGKKEIEEPFEKTQIGSSAMAYKRNPMRSERINALARFSQSMVYNTFVTANDQFLERTLDDSAIRRMSIPEAFLALDGVLILCANVCNGLVVYDKMIEKHLREELPFMATEDVIMEAAKKGADRQQLHERIRVHSMEAGRMVKVMGLENDLAKRIAEDPAFGMTLEEVLAKMDAKNLIGRCPEQVVEYVYDYIYPLLEKNADLMSDEIDTTVNV